MFLEEHIVDLKKVFLQERLWKSGKKRHGVKDIFASGLAAIADISAASVVKKPRQKWLLEVHRFEIGGLPREAMRHGIPIFAAKSAAKMDTRHTRVRELTSRSPQR